MKDKEQDVQAKGRTLNDVCGEILASTDGAYGAAVVDLDSGLVLGVAHKIRGFNDNYVEAIAAASVDLVRGRTVQAVENLVGNHFGRKIEGAVQELQVTTAHSFHFISVVPGKQNALFMLITDKKMRLGLGWTLVRSSLSQIAPLCP